MSRNLTLVITGSVAAVKTVLLAKALEKAGFDPACVITPAARGFLKSCQDYGASAADLARLEQKTIKPQDMGQGPVLVAPATAEIIRQLAENEKLGQMIRQRARPLVIAPAMNFMMWQHPAVQRNISILKKRGAVFLGPVLGDMACGDHGYGRMAEPVLIAEALRAQLDHKKHPLLDAFAKSIPARPHLPPYAPCRKILFFADDPAIAKPLASRLRKAGFELAVITRRFSHYQTDPQGMEHIRLAENADLVLFAGLGCDLAHEMAHGGAASFAGCLYLASKRPVMIIPAQRKKISPKDKAKLQRRGATVMGLSAAMKLRPALRCLVLGGTTRERVDSFRFYANHATNAGLGRETALALHHAGHNVTLIKAGSSTSALLDACRDLEDKEFDFVLQLCALPHIVCPAPADHKISKTGAERASLFNVHGNIDIKTQLRLIFPDSTIGGFDTQQRWFGPRALEKFIPPMPRKLATAAKSPPRRGSIVITTGRTEERLTKSGDIITNGFTGQQGQEIARVLARMGYPVTVISGPTHLPDIKDKGVRTLHVTTMRQMQRATLRALATKPLAFISVAAIADFGMKKPIALSLKPGQGFALPLVENPSIVAQVARHKKRPPVIVSFAAQSPEKILDYAMQKFRKLGIEMTVANPIGPGLDPARNTIHLVTHAGVETFPEMSKKDTARIIAKAVIKFIKKT